ncbi:MAG: hypothetical protein K6F80_04275, partial [Oscillospiraceae bacterium]|nr:hypothetical protein [Oscillospiraceae bacterium]
MNRHFRKAAAAILTAAVLTGLPSASIVNAADGQKKLVVLGDGISSGKGLEKPENSYVSLLERYYHYDVVNLAKDDCTSADLLATLDDPSVKEQLADADVIIFSVGLQDIMQPFQEEVNRFMAENNLEFTGIDEMFAADRSKINITDDDLSTEANILADALRSGRETCQANVTAIGEKLSAYPNAEIIGLNVYNALNTIEQYTDLSSKRRMSYDIIKNPAKAVLNNYVNAAYTGLKEKGIEVVDTFSAFGDRAYLYTGLNNMSYYPSEEGHALIAEKLKEFLGSEPELAKGDVNGDTIVNSKDATMILRAAAKFGAGN